MWSSGDELDPLPTQGSSIETHDYVALGRILRVSYELGWTVSELAYETGSSYGKVYRALRAAGTTFRHGGHNRGGKRPVNPSLWDKFQQQSFTHRQIGRWLANGLSLREIEMRAGLLTATVCRHVEALQATFGVSGLDELRAVLRNALLKK